MPASCRRSLARASGVQVLVGRLQPAEQHLLLRHRQCGVDPVPGGRSELTGQARVVQPVGFQLHGRPRVPRGVGALLGQHDLVRHRRQVDPVRLLVQVVLLGEVLLAEEIPYVRRLAVAVPLLRELGRLFGNRDRLQLARVGQVVVSMAVTVPGGRVGDRAQREERGEQLIEKLVVAPVLDQGHAQRRSQRLPVSEHAGLCGGQHGIGRLRDRHAYAEQPQQAHESVQAAFHPQLPSAGPSADERRE